MSIAPNPTNGRVKPMADRTLDLIRDLRASFQDMETEYRWIKNIVYLERSKNRNPEQGKASKRVRADPTGEQAVSMETALREVRLYEKHLRKASIAYWYKLVPAYEALHRAFEAIDKVYEPTDNQLGREGVSRAELRRAHRAKEKRERRDQGWGTG